jgi:hypothetical protein
MGWMDIINRLKISFKEIYFTHVYRELNMEVDYLSKKSLSKVEGMINYNFWVDGNKGPTSFFYLY